MVNGDWPNIDEAVWAGFSRRSYGIGVAGKRDSMNVAGSVEVAIIRIGEVF